MTTRLRKAAPAIVAGAAGTALASVYLLRKRRHDPASYYVSRRRVLLREFDSAVAHVRHLFVARYGQEMTDALITEARQEFDLLLPRLPYIGGKQPLTRFLVSTGWFLAMYRVLTRQGKTLEEVGELIYEISEAYIMSFPALARQMVGRLTFAPGRVRRLKRRALESQKRKLPGDYVYAFVPGDGATFDYGVDYLECASCKFLAAEGALELAPYLCPVDRLYSEAFGWGLSRTETIAEGAERCDFRFRKGGVTSVASRVLPATNGRSPLPPEMRRRYAGVPRDQIEKLLRFRQTHPLKDVMAGEMRWEYIACGQGTETLLLLPGGTRVGEIYFTLIPYLEADFRVIVPTYPPVMTADAMIEGLAAILDAEGAQRVDVAGQSYGAFVAQVFALRHPERVRKLVLSGAGPLVVNPREAKLGRLALRALPPLPEKLLLGALKRLLLPILTTQESEERFWRAYFEDLFTNRLHKADALSHFRVAMDAIEKGYIHQPEQPSPWRGDVLLIAGENDPVVTQEDFQRLPQVYRHVQVEMISGAGHTVGIMAPERYTGLIRTFLRQPQTQPEAGVPAPI